MRKWRSGVVGGRSILVFGGYIGSGKANLSYLHLYS